MQLYFKGDCAKYIGGIAGPTYKNKRCKILGVKKERSRVSGDPLYWVKWEGEETTYPYGIHQEHLELVKRAKPKWRM